MAAATTGGPLALAGAAAGFEAVAVEAVTSGVVGAIAVALLGIAFLAAFLYVYSLWLQLQFVGLDPGRLSLGGEATTEHEIRQAPYAYPDTPIEPQPVPPIAPPSIGWDEPSEAQFVYRIWGGRAAEWGSAWTPEDPRLYGPDKFRAAAGLPDAENTGTLLTIARLRDVSFVTKVRISKVMLPPKSYCPYEHPTVLEYVIPGGVGLDRVATIPMSPPYGGPPPNGCP
jgi:hypothetical protein